MKIHHLRNATFIIESNSTFLLIDPMLSKKGELPPLALLRHKPHRNPTVALPDNAAELLAQVTHCLITHCQRGHFDHLDGRGKEFLRKQRIPVVCHIQDKAYLEKRRIMIEASLEFWQPTPVLGGQLTAIPAQHGQGWIHNFMANGMGTFIQLPDEPSIYISGDTVYNRDVEKALVELKPDIAVVAAGNASLDIGQPILMYQEEIIRFMKTAPNWVLANHLEALNHCSMSRLQVAGMVQREKLSDKVFIPVDGETLSL